MSSTAERYALDANAFIQAKRRFYGFDFCPGYWRALIWHSRQGTVPSIDRVKEELLRGGDELADWVSEELGDAGFSETTTAAVAEKYAQMLAWVMAQPQFSDPAKAEFQQVADGWLAAYAKAGGYVVVTLEEFSPDARRRVPLPNVCRAFDVSTITPFEMLRRLGARLNWEAPS